jgi:hypothetical protein
MLIMIKIECKYHFEHNMKMDTWQCSISSLTYFGSHLEIVIQTYEPVTVIVGKTSSGFFVFFKSHYTGVDLESLFDIDENFAKLSSVCFEEKKAASVAFAIKRIGHLLSKPRRKRKSNVYANDELPF